MRTLEGRLQLGLSLSLLLLVGGVWWLGHAALHHTAEAFVLSRLQNDADALIAAFQINRADESSIGQTRLAPVYNQPYSGHYFAVETTEAKKQRSRSLWDQDLQMRRLAVGETASWRAAGPDGQQLLVFGGGFRKDDCSFTLVVAEDTTPVKAELSRFEWLFAAIAAAGLVFMILVQRFVVHRAFRQLQPVYRDIRRLEQGETGSLTEAVPGEILPLVHNFNRLLELYAQRLERSRNAAGNLAHALKGPLNLIMQRFEKGSWAADPELRETLGEQLERISRLIDHELKRARFAGTGTPGRQFAPSEEFPVLARLLERMYPAKSLDIEMRTSVSGPLVADREDMLELLGNLLDNACKWADSRVLCRVAQHDGETRLMVEDDGPGCSDTALEAVAGRGVRLDESVDGHGLGLSIVRDIVALYGGGVSYGRSDSLGGFRAAVTLPLRYPSVD